MTETLRELLTENEDDPEGVLWDRLRFREKCVKEDDYDEHRWYTLYSRTIKIKDRYFLYTEWQSHSEMMDDSDAGFPFQSLDDIQEVFPKEVTVIDYFTKEQLEKQEQ